MINQSPQDSKLCLYGARWDGAGLWGQSSSQALTKESMDTIDIGIIVMLGLNARVIQSIDYWTHGDSGAIWTDDR